MQQINHGQRDESIFPGNVNKKDSYDDKMAIMTSSIASNMDDSTPSDSGIQLLDSVSESIMSNSGLLEYDMCTPLENASSTLPDLVLPAESATCTAEDSKSFVMTKSDIDNSNVQLFDGDLDAGNIPDEMKTSTCSTFDTENIVYRRKAKKNRTHSTSGPKKRVSFHEDILKNTKTDNIHIEHGFITYKGYSKKTPQIARYSWCSEGDDGDMKRNDQFLYRNACSDVLDYGKTEIYDKDANVVEYDNSGVFEYGPQENQLKNDEFYKCSCSDSNSSLDSGDSNDNVKRNYGQAKSNSCDCIGLNSQNSKIITNINDNCYFSEPNIESMDDSFDYVKPKSVWSKEKKPKTSCLKRQTGVIEEYDIREKVKTFNVHHLPDHMNNIIDNSKFLFGSLKNIFGIPLPERGVPEGCEDLQSVYECVPDVESYSPVNKQRTFLSKSFDGGLFKKNGNPKKYVHTVDELLRRKAEPVDVVTPMNVSKENEKIADDFVDLGESVQASPINFRSKYIINCESTVYEHTGVSYETENSLPNSTTDTNLPIEPCTQKASATVPFTEKISNIFKSFRDNSPGFEVGIPKPVISSSPIQTMEVSNSMTSSITSTMSDNSVSTPKASLPKPEISITANSPNKNRHLASPMRKRSMITRYENPRMSPDLFGVGRETKTLLSEEFDDILTITTSTDQTDSDIVIVDYPEPDAVIPNNQLLKPPSTKSSLINRFLRNVTQKKIQDATIKKNTFLAAKVKNEKKLFENIYVKGAKLPNTDLIDDLNAEIALEIELSGKNSMASDLMRLSENKLDRKSVV